MRVHSLEAPRLFEGGTDCSKAKLPSSSRGGESINTSLTTEAFGGSVAFAEDSPIGIDESDSKDAAVLKSQLQWNADPFLRVGVRMKIDRAFNPVQAGNR